MSRGAALPASPPAVEHVIESAFGLPPTLAPRNLAELVFADRGEGPDDRVPVLLGTLDAAPLNVSLRLLRGAVLDIAAALERRGLRPGDTVCVVRLPRTSETLVAVAVVALSAWGARVLLPMYVECDAFGEWLGRAGAKAVLWSAAEVRGRGAVESDEALLGRLEAVAASAGVQALCMHDDLGLPGTLAREPERSPRLDEPAVARMLESTSHGTECLLLTTSGTSGRSKLVRYCQGALLGSCASWEASGLFRKEALGGRALSVLLCHSMGVRALWNALWTREPLCIVVPEWFEEHPERVRALLLEMRPEHVTGGPAAHRTLLELGRVFPQLKSRCFPALRCLVSSGAPFDASLGARVAATLGIPLHNAFGMTETMQVSSTLLGGGRPPEPGALGEPLAGVRVGLGSVGEHAGREVFRLLVSTPFGFSGYLAEAGGEPCEAPSWLETGDLVERTPEGLRFVGREGDDFFKDGFGVKVSRRRLHELYADLGPAVEHVECFAMREEPGAAAIVFVRAQPGRADAGAAPGRGSLRRVKGLLEARLERLRSEIEDFEFRHLTVQRFACVPGPPPRTVKGTVSRAEVERLHGELLERLTGRWVKGPAVVRLARERYARPSWVRLASPLRGELLRIARMDKDYVRASGDRLWVRERGRETEVVDFVGGFGGNLLGHRNPDVLEVVRELLAGGRAFIGDQGSALRVQGELARRLALAVGGHTGASYVVRLGSTGAEAVEMALAHAFLEHTQRLSRMLREQRRAFGSSHPREVRELEARAREALAAARPKLLAVAGAFHGHSLGARSALGSAARRAPFAPMSRIDTLFLPPDGDVDVGAIVERESIPIELLARTAGGQVSTETVRLPGVFAAIAEPVLGEGGVVPVDRGLLERLARHAFPLILDEIQCGLGRTGTFLASEGVHGDYYLFSKSLGGGVAKVSAVLIDRERYVDRFDEQYSSTFAGDAFSSAVACRVLEIVESQDVAGRARERGAAILKALGRVRDAFPDVVKQVRGRGLLACVELDPACGRDTFVLRMLARQDKLGMLASAYLLHAHRVRVLPTLSAPCTLRVEPSAFVDDAAIGRLATGLERLCRALRCDDLRELTGFLLTQERAAIRSGSDAPPAARIAPLVEPPAPAARRVGFVIHFVHPERELLMGEPSLIGLSPTALRELLHRLMEIGEMKPELGFARHVLGDKVWFLFVLLMVDAATLEGMHRSRERDLAMERIQDAVDLAASEGCEVVALGAHASILTDDGAAILPPPGVRVTSGNAFTTAVACQRILDACESVGIDPAAGDARLGVVGATGNIGSAIAARLLLGPRAFARGLLLARDDGALRQVRDRIAAARGERTAQLEVTTDLDALRRCDVIAIATSANAPIVGPRELGGPRRVVIGDVSVPGAVSKEAQAMPGVVWTALAGVVPMPGEPGFLMSSHTPPGTAFCCAVEAMLLALEPGRTAGLRLVGEIDPRSVEVLEELGRAHGFLPSPGGARERGSG